MNKKGYIYIIQNPLFTDLVKIGMTEKSVSERLSQLNNTSLPEKFKLIKKFKVDNPYKVEQTVHKILNEYRHTGDREFFKVPVAKAISTIEKVSNTTPEQKEEKYFDQWKTMSKEEVIRLCCVKAGRIGFKKFEESVKEVSNDSVYNKMLRDLDKWEQESEDNDIMPRDELAQRPCDYLSTSLERRNEFVKGLEDQIMAIYYIFFSKKYKGSGTFTPWNMDDIINEAKSFWKEKRKDVKRVVSEGFLGIGRKEVWDVDITSSRDVMLDWLYANGYADFKGQTNWADLFYSIEDSRAQCFTIGTNYKAHMGEKKYYNTIRGADKRVKMSVDRS